MVPSEEHVPVQLYLLRHAQADARVDGQDHPDRALTPKGMRQAQAVGAFARANGLQVDLALSSPYRRARETLEHAAETWPLPQPTAQADWLCIDTPTLQWLAGLRTLRAHGLGRVLLVGHEPDLSLAIAALLGTPRADAVKMRKGALACLSLPDEPGAETAQLRWLVSPDLLPG
jgi:phosphohistidine phosphatase